ncbi:MAG: GGDEF domain-containing protein [Desulfobulbaceae bacterium]|nr:GGDEF domain-containing protein [Desulfobulbaceae bacterium]
MSKPLNEALNTLLTSADLPTLPVVASRLLELTAREDAAFADIAKLIAQDIALSAKILKVANSSFYNFPRQIASINQAVSLLGINAVRSLVLSFTFLSMGKVEENSLFNLERFWEHSLVGATAAQLIAAQVANANTDEIFTISLLQNIGQFIFALTVPSRYNQILERLATGGQDFNEIALEEEFLGLPHTISGFEVARFWGFPPTILAAIRYHHDPISYPGNDPQELLAIKVVYLADLITKIFSSETPERYHQQFHDEAEQLLGLGGLEINTILKTINREIANAAHFFDIPVNPLRSVAEIIQEANVRLSLLHLTYEEMNRELIQSKKELENLKKQLAERNYLLDTLANLDGLTEINNHRFFQNFLKAEIERAVNNRCPIALLLADIDHFKQFNDTYGHQTGDFILKELCRIAQGAIREYDVMARYGGEEFVFVLPETGSEEARLVAQRICRTIADHDFFDGKKHYQVSVSIGVVSAVPSTSTFDKNQFIAMADGALYAAKDRGRNQAILFNPEKMKL